MYSGHLLLVEIRDIGIQVVFEMFICYKAYFHLTIATKPFGGCVVRSFRPPSWLQGPGPRKRKGRTENGGGTEKRENVYSHNTNTIALNNDRNKTQSGGLPERHKAHLSWPPIGERKDEHPNF